MTVKVEDFSEFDLLPEVFQAVEQRGYTRPTEIQSQAIAAIRSGRDVVGQAKTGTGKTAAFALPLLSRIDPNRRAPQVLVLAPTRELAVQVAEAFEGYACHLPSIEVATVYGGQGYGAQISQLKRGAHIIVGTPGRVIDHMKRGNLKLDELVTFVLDEADEMLRMGFVEDVQWVLGQAPPQRQTLLFSATLPDDVRRIADTHLADPVHIATQSKTMTSAMVSQRVCTAAPFEKPRLLSRILESEQTEGVIVFVKTKEMSSRLAENLCQRGFVASALNGDMQQQQRERAVQRLKAGKLDVVVATDVAARGLDVDRISHVINYDFPHDTEAYVHRIGRTGRAGREGHAILFASPRERHRLRHLERATGQKISWMEKPTEARIQAGRAEKLNSQLAQVLATGNMTVHSALITRFLAEHPDTSLEDLAAALVVIAMGDRDSTDDNERKPWHPAGRRNRADRSAEDRRSGGQGRDGKPRLGRRRDTRRNQTPSGTLEKYRIEVGHAHGVRPGNIVGAIANESGLSGADIGGIDIQTHFSTVDLPKDLSNEQLQGLRQLRVAGQPLRISKWDRGGNSRFAEKPRRFNKKTGGKPSWKNRTKRAGARAS